MSTPIAYDVHAVPESKPRSPGFLARFFEGLTASREAEAKRYLVNYLSSLSDQRLRDLGYTDSQIRTIRFEHRLPEVAA